MKTNACLLSFLVWLLIAVQQNKNNSISDKKKKKTVSRGYWIGRCSAPAAHTHAHLDTELPLRPQKGDTADHTKAINADPCM